MVLALVPMAPTQSTVLERASALEGSAVSTLKTFMHPRSALLLLKASEPLAVASTISVSSRMFLEGDSTH